jgi:acetylornithine deacetylase/succinyl-diaminopimelate desuccinylase-like protein
MSDVHSYIDANLPRFREELSDFLRIPSVSARREHRPDMRRAAEWLAERMRGAGLEVSIEETPGHPIVVGEWRGAGEGAPTVLIYGHYDVQPAEPLELWTSPPFEPTVRDGRLYARGSVDDKGQLYLHVKAIEAHLRTAGRLPVNVVVLAEGEEEVGSENLMPFVEAHAQRLAADYVVISDTTMVGPGIPTIGTSLRGLVYFEIEVEGPAQDLHSGMYGGAVINPATALARIIASFHDDDWRATIKGFYDDVDTPAAVRDQIEEVPFDEAAFQADTGAEMLAGEAGYGTLERLWTRPTVEVNGMISGYTGEGAKTVLPSRAMAKVSCRLVPDQDPEVMQRLFKAHVARVAPAGVRVEVRYLHGGEAWRASTEGPLYEAAARALEQAFGRPTVFAGEGGSIPIVPAFERVLDAPVLLMGFGLPGENAHAPDEWMSLENFDKGTHAAAELLTQLGAPQGT